MNEIFSQRLRELRLRIRMPQTKLASKLGVSQQTVAKWESGISTPNPETVAELAKVLRSSADYLLGISEQRNAESIDGIKFALWGGDADKISDEMLADVMRYARYIHEQKQAETENKHG